MNGLLKKPTTAANGHGHAVAMCGVGGGMQAVGDEPNDSLERQPGATGGRGFEEGAASPPRQPNMDT